MLVYLQMFDFVDVVIRYFGIGLFFMFGLTMNVVFYRKLHWFSMPPGDSVTPWT